MNGVWGRLWSILLRLDRTSGVRHRELGGKHVSHDNRRSEHK